MITTTKTPPALDTPLFTYWRDTYARLKLAGKSDNTKRLYKNTIDQFARCLGRPPLLSDLNDDTVAGFIAWTVDEPMMRYGKIGGRRSPRTANKHRDQLLAIWRFAARKRHVEQFPDVEPLKEPKRLPRAWSEEQMQAILASARDFRGSNLGNRSYGGIPCGVWWEVFLQLLYFTGLRVGAALQLRVFDFDAGRRRLFVPAEFQKQNADQSFPLGEEFAAALALFIAIKPRETIFEWPLSVQSVYNHYKAILKRAGLPAGRFDKFHKIRRTSATFAELFAGTGTATKHLGHADARVTERYLDRTMLPEVNVAEALPCVSAEPKPNNDGLPLAELVNRFADSMSITPRNLQRHRSQLERVFAVCGFRTIADLSADKTSAALVALKADGYSDATIDHYMMSLARFATWLACDERAGGNADAFQAQLLDGYASGGPRKRKGGAA
jgi:integrase